jgi:hypothetical protein
MAEVDDVLAEILRLRGAEYVCLADRTNGRIIGEAGRDGSATIPGVVVKLEMTVSDVLGSGSGDEFEDLMISSRYRYHLVRHVDSAGRPPLLLYLRLQRSRANLAVARRELASAELNDRLSNTLRGGDRHNHDDRTASIPERPGRTYSTRSRQPNPIDQVPVPIPVPRHTHQPDRSTGDENSPDALLVPLPRRTPASSRAGRVEREREPEPEEPAEMPSVVRQSWAFDRGTMERLVHGLRRMMP